MCAAQQERMDRVVAATGLRDLTRMLDVTPWRAGQSSTMARPSPLVRMIGVLPHLEEERSNIVAAPFLGRLDSSTLIAIGDLAGLHGESVRLTSDHSLAFCGVPAATAASLLARLRDLDLVVDHDDPRAALSACVGSSGCAWAHADTAVAARRLAETEGALDRVHLSACAKGCGAPARVRHLVADETGAFR
jgi:precorrin-3B synthase